MNAGFIQRERCANRKAYGLKKRPDSIIMVLYASDRAHTYDLLWDRWGQGHTLLCFYAGAVTFGARECSSGTFKGRFFL